VLDQYAGNTAICHRTHIRLPLALQQRGPPISRGPFKYLLAKGFDVELDRRLHVSQRLFVRVALANYDPFKPSGYAT
jgi:hypothetical protein